MTINEIHERLLAIEQEFEQITKTLRPYPLILQRTPMMNAFRYGRMFAHVEAAKDASESARIALEVLFDIENPESAES